MDIKLWAENPLGNNYIKCKYTLTMDAITWPLGTK